MYELKERDQFRMFVYSLPIYLLDLCLDQKYVAKARLRWCDAG
jgi:hypothetical protein